MRVFECPFRGECWKARQEQEATLYADNEITKVYQPNICLAPFLEAEGAGPICVLEVDRNTLTLENYLSRAETLKIHRPKKSLLEDLKEVFERRRKNWRQR